MKQAEESSSEEDWVNVMDKAAQGSMKQQAGESSDWRIWLQHYARDVYRRALAADGTQPLSGPSANQIKVLNPLGTLGETALRIVETYAVGAASRFASSGTVAEGEAPDAFYNELAVTLSGLSLLVSSGRAYDYGTFTQPKIFQSELWQILRKIRESAELSYAREAELAELDRRVMFLLGSIGPLPPADISAASGVDKAQISRSVKRLLQEGYVERTQIRSPILLTEKGRSLADKLLKLAELRNRELTFDVSDEELADFFSVMKLLLDRAIMLYEQERDLTQQTYASESGVEDIRIPTERRVGEDIVIDRSSIVAPLLTLSAYFSRSAALTFKRLTGLSNFEAWVLSEISQNPPIEWAQLVSRLDRDHSQSGRTINALIERGLVAREGKPVRRLGRFSPTAKGKELYAIIAEMGMKRSEFLMEPLSGERLEHFMLTFDKIRHNAFAQLERERALEEIENQ
ncbi:MarR family transcriptional regulator [Altericroceibacterium spongiae]|uniref:MarR family transcriptional regulator n=1 Tax=Altericroceibacterium spongiae TaxID=2320269 RepID=A0A420ES80_9SPHN|nr:MarR family transcriptional regulator [Altericroceibacterium spongiae]RKF23532.1 MarR family transcriptional regulator [Altericroceibacterium spongiae]